MKTVPDAKKAALAYAEVYGAFGPEELAPLVGMSEAACKVILDDLAVDRQLIKLHNGDYDLPPKRRANRPEQEALCFGQAAGGGV